MRGRTRRGFVTAVAMIVGWLLVSAVLPAALPGPLAVAERLPTLFGSGAGGGALGHVGASFARVVVATAVGLGLAVTLGLLLATAPRVEAIVARWLPFWMTVPSLVVVLVTMVLFRFSDLSVVTAVVVVATPFATVTVWEGAAAVDADLIRMAGVYGADRRAVVREIYLPAILPAIVGSARFLLSMVWKVVVLAETFGLSTGMGALFRFWFNQGDLPALMGALTLFIVVMVALQAGLTRLEDRLFAWRA